MNKKKVCALIIASTLLCSCNTRTLRSDIADYIASFSLQNAVDTYLEGRYILTNEYTENGEYTKDEEIFYFSVKDVDNFLYEKVTKTYDKDEKVIEEKNEHLEKENNEYYIVKNENKSKLSGNDEAYSYIEKFFYTKVLLEGSVHQGGMYYGDYVIQTAPSYQDYVKIIDDLYTFDAQYKINENEMSVYIHQTYQVNSIGMLVNNHLTMESDEITVVTNLTVYKL